MTLPCHLGQPGSSHCPSGSLSFLLYKVGAAAGRRGEWIRVHVWPSPFTAHLKLSQRVNWLHPNTKRSFPSPFTRNRHVSWLHSNTHAQTAAGGCEVSPVGTPDLARGPQWPSSFHVCFPDGGLGGGFSHRSLDLQCPSGPRQVSCSPPPPSRTNVEPYSKTTHTVGVICSCWSV